MVIVQALVTALLSGIFSGAVLFALNERRDRAKLILEKTEEAIESYQAAVDILSGWPIAHYKLFYKDNREIAEQAIDKIWVDGRAALTKARVLIAIYLPEFENPISHLNTALSPFLKTSQELRLAALNGTPLPDNTNEQVNTVGRTIVETGHRDLEALLEVARTRAHAPHVVSWPKAKPAA